MTLLGTISLYGIISMLVYATYVEIFVYKKYRLKKLMRRWSANRYWRQSLKDPKIIPDNIFEQILGGEKRVVRVISSSFNEGFKIDTSCGRTLFLPHKKSRHGDGYATHSFLIIPKEYRGEFHENIYDLAKLYDHEYVEFKERVFPKKVRTVV